MYNVLELHMSVHDSTEVPVLYKENSNTFIPGTESKTPSLKKNSQPCLAPLLTSCVTLDR